MTWGVKTGYCTTLGVEVATCKLNRSEFEI